MAKDHNKRIKNRFEKKKSSSHKGNSSAAKAINHASVHSKTIEHKSTEKKGFYNKYYKQLLIIPFLMLVAALVITGVQIAQTGQFVQKGISLTGGTSITITKDMTDLSAVDVNLLTQQLLDDLPGFDILIRSQKDLGTIVAIEIESNVVEDADLVALKQSLLSHINEITLEDLSQNIHSSGSTLGDNFFSQILKALLIAFVLMGIVVFIQFKVPVPSFAVILAAFSDIIVTLAVVNVIGMKLSTAGIAAFLMLIGYSVDTDILLSTRVLKNKEGTVYGRIIRAMKTGMTMNLTTLAAVTVALFISQSQIITQIMTILFIGLLVDMINTWIQNAGILRWYAESEKRKGKYTSVMEVKK